MYGITLSPTEIFSVLDRSVSQYDITENLVLDLSEIESLEQFLSRQNLTYSEDVCDVIIDRRRSNIKEITFNKFNLANNLEIWLTYYFNSHMYVHRSIFRLTSDITGRKGNCVEHIMKTGREECGFYISITRVVASHTSPSTIHIHQDKISLSSSPPT